jgi:pyrroline-5-carboxylate reductase
MGGAIAKGLFNHKEANESLKICLADVNEDKLQQSSVFCDAVFTDNSRAVADADVVILAVKPWLVEPVIEEISQTLDADRQIIVSIAAGVTIDRINQQLGSLFPVYRMIPNTAISIAESMTLIANQNTGSEQDILIGRLFGKLGQTLFIPESLMNAGTSLTSCGIAYAFRYIRAATEAGVEMGFPANQAKEMVAQTLIGAARLLMANDSHPEAEIDKVTTPGGLTIKGLNAMEEAGFTNSVIKGLKASCL